MASYASAAPLRVDQMKPNDLVRVNDVVSTKRELDLWANVLEVAQWPEEPGSKWSIHLGGGYQFVAEPNTEYCCRVALGSGQGLA